MKSSWWDRVDRCDARARRAAVSRRHNKPELVEAV